MLVEKDIAAELRDRTDLIQLLDASAEYLASRDKDASSQTRARWKLWNGPTGPLIGLQLDGEGLAVAQQFTPTQLDSGDVRELRLVMVWNDLLSKRTWQAFERVNALLRNYREEEVVPALLNQ